MTAAVAERSALADVQALKHARRLVEGYCSDDQDVDDLVPLDDLQLALVRIAGILTMAVVGATGQAPDEVLALAYETLARATVDG